MADSHLSFRNHLAMVLRFQALISTLNSGSHLTSGLLRTQGSSVGVGLLHKGHGVLQLRSWRNGKDTDGSAPQNLKPGARRKDSPTEPHEDCLLPTPPPPLQGSSPTPTKIPRRSTDPALGTKEVELKRREPEILENLTDRECRRGRREGKREKWLLRVRAWRGVLST